MSSCSRPASSASLRRSALLVSVSTRASISLNWRSMSSFAARYSSSARLKASRSSSVGRFDSSSSLRRASNSVRACSRLSISSSHLLAISARWSLSPSRTVGSVAVAMIRPFREPQTGPFVWSPTGGARPRDGDTRTCGRVNGPERSPTRRGGSEFGGGFHPCPGEHRDPRREPVRHPSCRAVQAEPHLQGSGGGVLDNCLQWPGLPQHEVIGADRKNRLLVPVDGPGDRVIEIYREASERGDGPVPANVVGEDQRPLFRRGYCRQIRLPRRCPEKRVGWPFAFDADFGDGHTYLFEQGAGGKGRVADRIDSRDVQEAERFGDRFPVPGDHVGL